MGELQHQPFQFTFNGFLKVTFEGSRVTSDAGLILVRELDERLGLEQIIAEQLSVLAYNLGNLCRRLVLSARIDTWFAHEPAATPRQDGRTFSKACLLLAPARRGSSDAAPLWGNTPAHLGTAGPGRLIGGA